MNRIHPYFLFLILGLFGAFVFAVELNGTSSRPEEEKNVTIHSKTSMRKDLNHWGRHLRDKIHHRCIRGRHHMPISSSTMTDVTANLPLSTNQTKDVNATSTDQISGTCLNESKIEEHKPSCENSSSMSPRSSDSTVIPKDLFNFWRPFAHFKTSENISTISTTSETVEKSDESKPANSELKDNKSTTQDNIFILEGLGFFEDPLVELPKTEEDYVRKQNWFNPFGFLFGHDQDPLPWHENDAGKTNFWNFDLNKLFKFEPASSTKNVNKFPDTGKLIDGAPLLELHDKILNTESTVKTLMLNDSKLSSKNIIEKEKIVL